MCRRLSNRSFITPFWAGSGGPAPGTGVSKVLAGFQLHAVRLQVYPLQGGVSHSAGWHPDWMGQLGMMPHVGGIGSLWQPHGREALQPARSNVLVASCVPQVNCPSSRTSTISVSPVTLNVPIGTSPACGSNCTES